ncbi:MAG TPA: serine/threonine-protein kinase [Kofleriaceae bacterium]
MGKANQANDAAPETKDGAADEPAAALDATLAASDQNHGPVRSGPSKVGRYQIRDVLGAGAMGVVYRAHDPDLGRAIAIKLVRDSRNRATSHLRLLREAQAMARLRHPNVVPIFDVGQADGAVFVAMPLLEGGTLRSWLGDRSQSFDAILDRFTAAGRGLAAAHSAGLVHRDFKPDNVLLGTDGEIHVADFGLARLVDADLTPSSSADPLAAGVVTQTGTVLGTPAYMAPEQLRGSPIDERADQFSYCVALWEALYGERPFRDPPRDAEHPLRARLEAIAAGPVPPSRRDRPAWIAPMLVQGLAVDPDRRWPTLQAMLDAITQHRTRRRWPRWLAIALSAIGLAAAIAALARSMRPEPAPRPDPAPRFHLVPLIHRDGLTNAAISPDGGKLAIVAGDSLKIRGIEPDAPERTIADHGMADKSIAWSPDGKYLLASRQDKTTMRPIELIHIDDGARSELPVTGIATFLSSTEIATTAYRRHTVEIFRLGGHAATAICDVPGDYTFLWELAGLPDGTMVVATVKDETPSLVILRRDCSIRATFSAEPISSFAVSDTGTIVAMAVEGGIPEILELSLDAEVLSRRRVAGAPHAILGRRRGIDYVSTLAVKTHLDQVHDGQLSRRFSVDGSASFSLAPDGQTLAWIDFGDRSNDWNRLRLSPLPQLSRSGPVLLDNARTVSWSPDGTSLAVAVEEAKALAILVLDRSGRVLRRLPMQHRTSIAAPIWLDDHRIAAQTGDRTTYRWFDLETGEQGEVVDSAHGSTYWLTRSPRDGTLAMWRNGPPGVAKAEHLWIKPVGQPARPLHVAEAAEHALVPSWSASGELLVRARGTGQVWRVALDTGELTQIAQLPPAPLIYLFDDQLKALPDGDLLAVDVDLAIDVYAAVPDNPEPLAPGEPGPGRR